MIRMKAFVGAVAMSALAAACSGGESEPSEPAEASAEEAMAPEDTTTEEGSAEEAAVADDPMATEDGVAYASLTGDAAAGKRVFAQCRTCHVTDPGVNRIGPSLAGIIGKEAGAVDGFNYSPANANSGISWTEEQMYVYLEDPQRTIPKTKMIYAGLPDAQQRADVIAYLKDPS
ncbi:MAG: c-type cytochrome [Pseudomonadota bacterium]